MYILENKTISPEQLMGKLREETVYLLDVRSEEKYHDFHIEGPNLKSMNIPKNAIFNLSDDNYLQELPKGKEVVLTCTTGNSARKCASILSSKNYDVIVLEGGITAWREYIGK